MHRVRKLLDHGYLHLDFEGWSLLEPQVHDPVRGLLQTYSGKAIPNETLGLGYTCNCRLVGDLCVCVCDSSMGEWQAYDSNTLEL